MTPTLVTGATGFVGKAVIPLLSNAGLEIVAGVREVPEQALQHVTRTQPVGDIGPNTSWDEALSDVDAVVHLAARAHAVRKRASTDLTTLYRRINTEGTLHLARQAAAYRVKRFVFVSTIKVNGDRTTGDPFTEVDKPTPAGDYARSKLAAETGLREIADETGIEVVILRPPLVYGKGVKGNFLSLLRLVSKGIPLPLARVSNQRSLIYVENLGDAIKHCLFDDSAANQTFLIRDGEDVSTPDLVRRLRQLLGVPDRILPFPESLLRLTGQLTGQYDKVGRLVDSLTIDDSKLRTTLQWSPPHTLNDGLTQTAKWYRSAHLP